MGRLRGLWYALDVGRLATRSQMTADEYLAWDQRVTMASRGRYVYPDVNVVCGGLELEAGDVLQNPTIVVEVLSSTAEQYDRGLK